MLEDSCEAFLDTMRLSARNQLSKEVDSRQMCNQFINYNLQYESIADFTIMQKSMIVQMNEHQLDILCN